MKGNEDVMAVARAFMRSRIILTAAELDLFTVIGDSMARAEEIAEKYCLDLRALERVLDALAGLGTLNKGRGGYSLTEESASYSSKHPFSQLPMLLHMSRLWNSWSDLTDVVRKGPESQSKSRAAMDKDDRRAFIQSMHVVGRTLSDEIAASVDLEGYCRLLDIGGGSGTYIIALLKLNPQLQGILFDLEDVIPMARERLSSEGLLDRAELVSGNFYEDELPTRCDVALLSAIIHQNSPQQNLDLYRKAHRALEPGGLLLIRDHIMNEDRTQPPEGALFAINMLVNTKGGDTYTFEEVAKDLREAGFKDVRLLRSGERMDCVVGAVKPG